MEGDSSNNATKVTQFPVEVTPIPGKIAEKDMRGAMCRRFL